MSGKFDCLLRMNRVTVNLLRPEAHHMLDASAVLVAAVDDHDLGGAKLHTTAASTAVSAAGRGVTSAGRLQAPRDGTA
jgi:hypothetical protein